MFSRCCLRERFPPEYIIIYAVKTYNNVFTLNGYKSVFSINCLRRNTKKKKPSTPVLPLYDFMFGFVSKLDYLLNDPRNINHNLLIQKQKKQNLRTIWMHGELSTLAEFWIASFVILHSMCLSRFLKLKKSTTAPQTCWNFDLNQSEWFNQFNFLIILIFLKKTLITERIWSQ